VKHILVVDDDPHLRDVVVYTLQREGHGVTAVHDGRAALEALLGPSCKHFDLVVLDILMPEVDGLEVCRRLRASPRAHLPVVFLSSRDEEIDKVLGLEMGGDDYVTKPFSPRELAARVKENYDESWIIANVRKALAQAALHGNTHIRAFADVDGKARMEGVKALIRAVVIATRSPVAIATN
jgi:two-component system OmpR family response regulator